MRSGWTHWNESEANTIRGDIMLSKDFREFVALLNEFKIRYLVVGGYAVAFHGYPRYTKDFDVWIEMSPTNADKLIAALVQFGFGELDLKPDDFLKGEQIIQLGYPPNRIDILTTLTGLNFDVCYTKRIETNIQDLHINFLDLESLKINKRATGLAQDLADIENLE
jgi:hypothetical protein